MNRTLWTAALSLSLSLAALPGLSGAAEKPPAPPAVPGADRAATAADKADAGFARAAFTELADGKQSVGPKIDWRNFMAMGVDVGKIYRTMPDDANRAAFRKSFITSFAKSFHAKGAKAENLTDWHVKSRDSKKTVVASTTPAGGSFLITIVLRNGVRKMSVLQAL